MPVRAYGRIDVYARPVPLTPCSLGLEAQRELLAKEGLLVQSRFRGSRDHTPSASQKLVEEPVTRTPPHAAPLVPSEGNRLKTPSLTALRR